MSTACVFASNEEHNFQFENLVKSVDEFKSWDFKFDTQANQHTFDFVVVNLMDPELCPDDIEMIEEKLQYYLVAPILAWVAPANGEKDALKEMMQKFKSGSDCFFYESTNESKIASITEALNACKAKYQAAVDGDVKSAFNAIDKDGSGGIDKNELGSLMSTLSQNLTDEELEKAMKELDLNGDGVISFHEFCRWYFTGMKSYSLDSRSLLLAQGHARYIYDIMKLVDDFQDPKLKTHSLSVSFNAPAEARTHLDYTVYFPAEGTRYSAICDEIFPKCGEFHGEADADIALAVVTIPLKAEAPAEILEKINSVAPGMIHVSSTATELTVSVGGPAPVPQLPQDVLDALKGVEQKVSISLDLGVSAEDITELDTPLLQHANSGFKVSASASFISNVKKAVLNKLKDDTQQLSSQFVIFAPVAMLELGAQVDLKFDDFDEIKDHPIAATFMPSFKELLEGMMGFDFETGVEPFDLEAVPESKREGYMYDKLKKENGEVAQALELLKAVSDEGLISCKGARKGNAAFEGNFASKGLSKLFIIGMMSAFKSHYQSKYDYLLQEEEE